MESIRYFILDQLLRETFHPRVTKFPRPFCHVQRQGSRTSHRIREHTGALRTHSPVHWTRRGGSEGY